MGQLLQDIRHGTRVLLKARGFTAVAILILSVGIGATSTVFTITNAMLFRPLNGGKTGDLVRLYSRDRSGQTGYRRFSYPNYEDIRRRTDLFAELAAYTYDFVGVAEGAATRRAFAGFVSASYFTLLRVPMAQGRAFTAEEDAPGASPVVVVSHEYWTSRGADRRMLGSTLVVGGRPRTVIGITPPGFTGTMAVTAPPLWLPLGQTAGGKSASDPAATLRNRNQHFYGIVGRLAGSLTPDSAAPGVDLLSRALEGAFPAENRNQTIEVRPMPRIGDSGSPASPGPFQVVMGFVLAMATALLLIVALNLANMLLARGGLRQRELAVRLAVGAGRWTVVRQLLVESSLLSLAGGLLGLGIAYVASGVVASALLSLLPMFDIVFDPAPDVRVLAATLGFATLGTLVFGLGPALRLSRMDLVTALKGQVAPPSGGTGLARTLGRNGLAVAQIALSLVLLTAGGLFFFGAVRARTAEPGFSLDRGIVATADAGLAGYDSARARDTMVRVLERIRALNGVEAASFASTVPFGESSEDRGIQPAGAPPETRGMFAVYRAIGADYFRTLGVPFLRGREFTVAEEASTGEVRAAIVDAELAERLWPGENPIGQRIQWPRNERVRTDLVVCEVVGVVGGMRDRLFDARPRPHLYVPYGAFPVSAMTFHVKGKAGGREAEAGLLAGVGAAIRAVDDGLPLVALKTLVEHRDTGFEVWFIRLAAQVFTVFGIVALAVAMVGLYGVRSVAVGRRTREFGIRLAIGATPGSVMRLVVAEGARVLAVGLGVGLLLSVGVSRMLAGWVYGVRTFEPGVFLTASLLLVMAMLAACYLPARRATAVQPATALRNE